MSFGISILWGAKVPYSLANFLRTRPFSRSIPRPPARGRGWKTIPKSQVYHLPPTPSAYLPVISQNRNDCSRFYTKILSQTLARPNIFWWRVIVPNSQ